MRAASVALVHGTGEATRVLMVRRGPGTLLEGTLALPGGQVEAGEHPAEAAARELHEETGIALPAGALEPGFTFRFEGWSPAPLTLEVFVARASDPRPDPHPGSDAVEVAWEAPTRLLGAWRTGRLALADSVRSVLAALASTPRPSARPAHEPAPARLELHPGLRLCALPSRTLPPATHTNAYLLGAGEERVLVDPGAEEDEDLAALLSALEEVYAAGGCLREVWLTHHHRDHWAALPLLRRRFPLRCRAHPETLRALPAGIADGALSEGEVVALPGPDGGEQRWEVVFAPGHTRGHLVFIERRLGALLAGDHVAGVGTVIVDPPEGDMVAYMATLERLIDLDARLLLPGHGPPSLCARQRLTALRAHRQARERRILEALSGEPRPLAAIVARAYTDVPRHLHVFAERSALAHLLALERAGEARRHGERWSRVRG